MEWQQVGIKHLLVVITNFTNDTFRFEVNYTVTLKSTALVTEFRVKNLNGENFNECCYSMCSGSFSHQLLRHLTSVAYYTLISLSLMY